MSELKSEFLMRFEASLKDPLDIGDGAMGMRAIYDVTGGSFEGPRMNGIVIPSGGDWVTLNPALGIISLDVRATLQTDDGANIFITYGGRLALPPERFTELFDTSNGPPDPASYYFRTAPTFETGSEKYSWLNTIQAIGIGQIMDGGVAYDLYEIK